MPDVDLTYVAGTCSVGVGATSVVGVSTLWAQPTNVRQWDLISIDGGPLVPIVASPADDTHLTIPAWSGVAKAGVTYVVYQVSPLRFVGAQAMVDVETMLAALNTDGWYRYVNPAFAGPTEQGIVANEGQFALKYTTGQLWIMTSGVWVLVGTFKPFGVAAPYDNAHTYNLQDVATLNGSSYVWINPTAGVGHAPPNATFWALLAGVGATGPAPFLPPVAWLTATNYVAAAPASYVSINGASYVCLIAHTSGTFATDLAAGKWGLVALAGLGYGGSSVTSQTPGTGSKTFALSGVNFAYAVGNYVRMSSAAGGANYIEGFLTAFSSTSATINVLKFGGTGAHTDWNFSLAGVPGAGDLISTNNLSELTNKATARTNLGLAGLKFLQARLTLLPGVSETSSDIAGAGTVYVTPHKGNVVSRYDGAAWNNDILSEISVVLDATTTDTGYHIGGNQFDVFYFSDSGTPRAGTGPNWSGVNLRGTGAGTTEVEFFEGVWVNKNSIVLRFGNATGNLVTVPARQATLIGSFRTDAVNAKVSDTKAFRFVSNVADEMRQLYTLDAAGNWNYSVATYREINNNIANRLQMLCCLPKKAWARYMVDASNSTNTVVYPTVNIGVDSATTGTALQAKVASVAGPWHVSPEAYWEGELIAGYHFLAALERGAGTADVQSWFVGSVIANESAPFIGGVRG